MIEDQRIEIVHEIKNLGIIIDDELYFNNTFIYAKKKVPKWDYYTELKTKRKSKIEFVSIKQYLRLTLNIVQPFCSY